jgi:ABC-2 type transport system ATP-binding protein
VDYQKDSDIRRDVFSAMVRIDCPILEMQSGNETLEEMFLRLTKEKGGKTDDSNS